MAKQRLPKEIAAAKLIKAKMQQSEAMVSLSTKVLSKTKQEITNDINWFFRNVGTKGIVEFEDAYSYLTKAQREEYSSLLREINKDLKWNFSPKQVKQIFANYSSARTNYDALRNLINLRSINASGSLIKLYDNKYGKIKVAISFEYSKSKINERIIALAGNLASIVGQNILQAMALKSEAKTVLSGLKDAIERTDYGYARIVRTETNRIINAQELEYYRNELGNEGEVMISAILDKHTCEFCEDMDGKIVKIKDAEVGINIPPFHPNDRCIIVAA